MIIVGLDMAVCQNLVPLVNIKIAGKWMFIPLKMVLIGIDPYPYLGISSLDLTVTVFLISKCCHLCRKPLQDSQCCGDDWVGSRAVDVSVSDLFNMGTTTKTHPMKLELTSQTL